jgi:hypothetical protein
VLTEAEAVEDLQHVIPGPEVEPGIRLTIEGNSFFHYSKKKDVEIMECCIII